MLKSPLKWKSKNSVFVSYTNFQFTINLRHVNRGRVGGGGGGLPCPFSKLGKKCPNFEEKNALIVVIYELNLSFKIRVVDDCLSRGPNSKKTPLP